jgi:diadenylate cyclase
VSHLVDNAHIFLGQVGWRDLLDILIVAIVIYQLLKLVRGTQAAQLLVGILVIALVGFLANKLDLRLIQFLYQNTSQALLVAVVVLFQPELRRAVDQVGRLNPVRTVLGHPGAVGVNRVVDEALRAAASMGERKIGALIVFERETGLENVAATGVRINSEVTAELLATVFFTGSPLHDGAAIIRDQRLIAAGCLLPLAETIPNVGAMGMRHRAAIGLTLQCDAVVLIVSEETRLISLAYSGKLLRGLDLAQLNETLLELLGGEPQPGRVSFPRPFLRNAGAGFRSRSRPVNR